MDFTSIFLMSILLMLFAFAGIGIKILIKKDGKFSGTCASQNPYLKNEDGSCGYCGKPVSDDCNETA